MCSTSVAIYRGFKRFPTALMLQTRIFKHIHMFQALLGAIYKRLKDHVKRLLLYARDLRKLLEFVAIYQSVKRFYSRVLTFVAMYQGFKRFPTPSMLLARVLSIFR